MMSHTQLTAASDEEMFDLAPPKPRTSRWRGVGFAVMVVGLVCMVGAIWPRKRVTVTPRQRLSQMRDAMMQAFNQPSLQDASNLRTRVEFVLGEVGADEPSAVAINAKVTHDQDAPEDLVTEFTFNANVGAGADLKAALDELLDELIIKLVYHYGGNTKDMRKLFALTQDDDSVRVAATFDPNSVPEEKMKEVTEVMKKKPEFSASFKLGRDFDAVYEHRNDNMVTAWGGMHFTLDAKFKGLVIDLLKNFLASVNANSAHWAESLALVAGKLEFRYKKEDELGNLLDKMPRLEEAFQSIRERQEFSAPGLDARKKILERVFNSINGLKMVEMRGLPQDQKLTIEFTNCKPFKLLAKVLKDVQPAPENDGDIVAEE